MARVVPQGRVVSIFRGLGRATVKYPMQDAGRMVIGRPNQGGVRHGESLSPIRGVEPPAVARPTKVWQRHGIMGIRTEHSALLRTGQPLNGMHRLDSVARRCRNLSVALTQDRVPTAGPLAARELSGSPYPSLLEALSAFCNQSHSIFLPKLILGGEPRSLQTSLRSVRTVPPRENPDSFGRTHRTLPGANGVDTKHGRGDPRTICPGRV